MPCFTRCAETVPIVSSGKRGLTEAKRLGAKPIRALDHGFAKQQCKKDTISKFPQAIQDFADLFVQLQEKRHAADYDPTVHFSLSDARQAIDSADLAIRNFNVAGIRDKRAFAAWTVMKNRN